MAPLLAQLVYEFVTSIVAVITKLSPSAILLALVTVLFIIQTVLHHANTFAFLVLAALVLKLLLQTASSTEILEKELSTILTYMHITSMAFALVQCPLIDSLQMTGGKSGSLSQDLLLKTPTLISNDRDGPLVGIHPNPGPKTKVIKATVKKGKKSMKVVKFPAHIKGRGDYSTDIGSALGGLAGKAIGSIFGSGAYSVSKNTLMSNAVPEFALSSSKRGNEFSHREFMTDVFSGPTLGSNGTLFNLNQYIINPADNAMFPWLSQIAENFEEYELLGLIFEYIPSSGNAVSSTNAALGTIVIATQYNSLDAAFTSKRQMESYEFAVSTVPSMSVIHPVECARAENALTTLYVNNPGAQTSIGDPRFSNLGILNIATVGQQAINANLGELWVSAHIRFKRPRLAPGSYGYHATGGPFSASVWSANNGNIFSNSPSTLLTVDTANTTIGGVVLSTSGSVSQLAFPAGYDGNYLLIVTATGIGTGTMSANDSRPSIASYTGGCSSLNFFATSGNSIGTTALGGSGSVDTGLFIFAFKSNGTAGTLVNIASNTVMGSGNITLDVTILPIGQSTF
jgi:hypothetical protein